MNHQLVGVGVTGQGERELACIPFRFADDLQIVSLDKTPLSLAHLVHKMSVVHGVAEFELADHEVSKKLYEVSHVW